LVGTIPISAGSGQTPGGLWALTFGGGGNDGSPNTLFFTDGIDGETHGLFGEITSVPLVGASTPTHSTGSATFMDSSSSQPGTTDSTSQLVQAMAGFGGGSGAAAGLNAAPLSADTSQQSMLTIPQHV
jgi:hypothetical protein